MEENMHLCSFYLMYTVYWLDSVTKFSSHRGRIEGTSYLRILIIRILCGFFIFSIPV